MRRVFCGCRVFSSSAICPSEMSKNLSLVQRADPDFFRAGRGVGGRTGRQQILDLRAVKFGRVNFKQRIAAHHQLARGIHVKFFNPTLEFGGHVAQRRLVVINDANSADDPAQRPARDGGGADIHVLNRHRINGDGLRLAAAACVFIHRHHVHAHAVLARRLPHLARHHRGFVVFDFALARRRSCAGRAGCLRIGVSFMPQMGQLPGWS